MKKRHYHSLFLAAGGCLLMLSICSCGPSKPKVEYPFKDGDTFTYEKIAKRSGGVKIRYVYKIERTGADFTVRRFQTVLAPNGDEAATQLSNSEKVFNKYGEMKKRANGETAGKCRGYYCQLWLVPELRKVGAKVKIAEFAKPAIIVSEEERDGKTVLLATYGNAKLYYDKTSGYLVERGFQGKRVK